MKIDNTENQMYADLETVNKENIMKLPGAWFRRAFSIIGGKANKKFEDVSKGLTKQYKEKQIIDNYIHTKTNTLNTIVEKLSSEKTNLEIKVQDYENKFIKIKETLPEDLGDYDLNMEDSSKIDLNQQTTD